MTCRSVVASVMSIAGMHSRMFRFTKVGLLLLDGSLLLHLLFKLIYFAFRNDTFVAGIYFARFAVTGWGCLGRALAELPLLLPYCKPTDRLDSSRFSWAVFRVDEADGTQF
mmetsp:Transcript_11757/g.15976  ORF Transcript_11757/g.15976 Transcript_11757/m.15976 type:complete len:111 (+) Transcript_11757:719-1051(+)